MTSTLEDTIRKLPIIKPPRLLKGDRIGIVSPAGPVDASDLRPGLELLEASGFSVRLAPHVYDRENYLAGKDEDRLSDLHDMLQDEEIKAVMCARGGYGSLRLLDGIRYDLISKAPKIIAGYSDITALLMAIHKHTGLITFHGPMVRGLAGNNGRNWESLLTLIASDRPVDMDLKQCTALLQGKASGPLIGGNLSLVCHLLGTPYLPSLEGCILFIEDRGESLYRVDRMLTYLALTGKLEGISGLIAGRFEECGNETDIHKRMKSIVSKLGIPLVTGFPVGHGQKNIALPLGLTAELDTEIMTLSIGETCVA
jgi:muramoyltetrapeptide carboxypeptidase